MATKRICDRCGKECGGWLFYKMLKFPESTNWVYVNKDLCSDCVKELNKFMNGAKVE